MFGLGEILQGVGGTLSTFGNYKSQKKSNKALQEGLNDAKSQYARGTTDAAGNRYYQKGNGWGYDLSGSGKAALNLANRNMYNANALGNINPTMAAKQATASNYRAAQMQANANQSAAKLNALRSGSNLGDIATSFGRQGSSNLLAQMQNNLKNGRQLQAQNANMYITNAVNARQPIENIQTNLQQQQQIAPAQMLNINQALAQVNARPKTNWMQLGGKLASGWGTGIANSDAADREMAMELFKAILAARYGGGGFG